MYLLLARHNIFAALTRLAEILICAFVRFVGPVNTAANALGYAFFHISHGSSRRWIWPSGDTEVIPSRLLIASDASENTHALS